MSKNIQNSYTLRRTNENMLIKINDCHQNISDMNLNKDECYENGAVVEIAKEELDNYKQSHNDIKQIKKKRAEVQKNYFNNNKKTYYERQKKWRDNNKDKLNERRRKKYTQNKLLSPASPERSVPPPPRLLPWKPCVRKSDAPALLLPWKSCERVENSDAPALLLPWKPYERVGKSDAVGGGGASTERHQSRAEIKRDGHRVIVDATFDGKDVGKGFGGVSKPISDSFGEEEAFAYALKHVHRLIIKCKRRVSCSEKGKGNWYFKGKTKTAQQCINELEKGSETGDTPNSTYLTKKAYVLSDSNWL
jgi:hypothetical protein